MWAFWVCMITVLPRIACYFFRLVGLPRAGIAAGICVAALLIWGTTRGRTQIRVSRTEVCSERIPAGFDGFRIVQFSDVHLGTLVCPEAELSRIADSINSLHPDLVVFCGDLVNIRGSELDARAMRLLGGLRAPYGVVSVTGNHDAGVYIKDSIAHPAQASLAEVVARQRKWGGARAGGHDRLRRGGDSTPLTGLSTPHCASPAPRSPTCRPQPERRLPRRPRLALQHHRRAHSPALGPNRRRGIRRPDPFGPHAQHAAENTPFPDTPSSPAQLILHAVERSLRRKRPHTLYQRRHGVRRIPDASGRMARNHTHNAEKMRVTHFPPRLRPTALDDNSPRRLIVSTPELGGGHLRLCARDAILVGARHCGARRPVFRARRGSRPPQGAKVAA